MSKGARVRMQLAARGIELTGMGIATEPGALGDQISVLNPNSHMVVQAQVTGPDAVSVAPGAAAIPQAIRGPAPQVAQR